MHRQISLVLKLRRALAPVVERLEPRQLLSTTTSTLNASADAMVRGGSYASTNYGTTTPLWAKNGSGDTVRQEYFKFDIASVANASNATISNVKLRLYGALSSTEASNLTFGVRSVADTTWSESALNWNNKPAQGTSDLATQVVTDDVNRWYEFDVTAYVQQQKAAGKSSVSLAVIGTAVSAPGFSVNSKEASGNKPQLAVAVTTPDVPPPAAPGGLAVTTGSATPVTLTWVDNSSTESGFVIRRRVGPAAFATIATPGANVVTYTDTTAVAGQTYDYQVTAVNAAGESAASNTATAATQAQPTQTVTSPVTDDVTVRNGSYANTNYGNDFENWVKVGGTGYERQAYLKFDINTLTAGQIQNAKLRLYGSLSSTESTNLTFNIKAVNSTTWDEDTLTWNNKPSVGSTLASVVIPDDTKRWYEIDISPYVQQQRAAGATSLSLAVVGTVNSPAAFAIWSKENTTGTPEIRSTVSSATPWSNVSVVSLDEQTLRVNWTDQSTTETGWDVQLTPTAAGGTRLTIPLPANPGTGPMSYDFTALAAATPYEAVVIARMPDAAPIASPSGVNVATTRPTPHVGYFDVDYFADSVWTYEVYPEYVRPGIQAIWTPAMPIEPGSNYGLHSYSATETVTWRLDNLPRHDYLALGFSLARNDITGNFWAKVNGVSIPLYQDSTTYGAFIAGSTYSQGSAYPGYRYRHDSDAPVVLTFGVTGLPAGATWRMANLEAQTYLTQVTLSADKAAVSESDDAAGRTITYTATRSIPEAVPLTPANFPSITLPLQWTGTAGEADFDTTRPSTVTLPGLAGSNDWVNGIVQAVLKDDALVEPDETVVLALLAGALPATGPATGPATAPATLKSDDFNFSAATITFNDEQRIRRDTGDQELYGTTQWDDQDGVPAVGEADSAYPLSYVRSTPTAASRLKVTPTFTLTGDPKDLNAQAGAWYLVGDDKGFANSDHEFEATATFNNAPAAADGTRKWVVTTGAITSSEALGDLIWLGDLKIAWRLEYRPTQPAATEVTTYGESVNRLYVTGTAATQQFETVLQLGCSGAIGLRPQDSRDQTDAAKVAHNLEVIEAIWSKFTNLGEPSNVKRVDGTPMTYWNAFAGPGPYNVEFFTTAGLLKHADGRCGSWADLFNATTRAQGGVLGNGNAGQPLISFTRREKIVPPPAGTELGFFVPYKAQNTPNPQKQNFHDHVATFFYDTVNHVYHLYDPSYGTNLTAGTFGALGDAWVAAGKSAGLKGQNLTVTTGNPVGPQYEINPNDFIAVAIKANS